MTEVLFNDYGDTIRVRRRNQTEMHMDVLKLLAEGPQRPTKIMYGVNTSWGVLKGILSSLTKAGCVSTDVLGARKIYRLTDKGENALRSYTAATIIAETPSR